MRQRTWIPVALVLAVLLGGTAGVGLWLRDRLDDAAMVLDPIVDSALGDQPSATDDLGVPVCGDGAAIVAELRDFLDAVEQMRIEAEADGVAPPDLTPTRASFDSFLARSARARLGSGPYSLVVTARQDDGRWCLDEADFSIEE